ncbi:MAG: LysR family transcriptional regulator [Lachnospiraceae bacterium]|jgi:DNA-binding transcriptional LysR family regulator|nr:LysR family transcriptional regulator [Lachnospiraceae bacterium]
MTIRHLKVFVAVCEEGSVTKAAAKLYLAQPSVSQAIGELEKYYNVKLFDRIAKRLYLTDAGRRLWPYASHIISSFREMEEGITRWGDAGSLSIGCSVTIGNHLLAGWLAAMRREKPEVELRVQVCNSAQLERLVLANDVDFALIEGISHSDQIVNVPFMEDELVAVCAPGYVFGGGEPGRRHGTRPTRLGVSLTLAEVLGEPFLMREVGSGSREIWESALRLRDMHMNVAWESISTGAIKSGVMQGLGVAVLPLLLVKRELDEGALVRVNIKDFEIKRKLAVIYHKNKYLTQTMVAFFRLCGARAT